MKNIFIILFVISFSLQAHPIDMTKMKLDANQSNPTLTILFSVFNIEKPLSIEFFKLPTNKNIALHKDKINIYVKNSIKIKNNSNTCKLNLKNFTLLNRKDIELKYQLICNDKLSKLYIDSNLFFQNNTKQSIILNLLWHDNLKSYLFNHSSHSHSINLLTNKEDYFKKFKEFFKEGIWHIMIGYDHIAFLLMLLVSQLLTKHKFKTILVNILMIVTAFTLSHSISLMLRMLDIVKLDDKFVEVTIAVSVLIVSLNNIIPFVKPKKIWLVAFVFGFIHGFGFANVLSDLNLPTINFVNLVLGFNLGVEFGQLVIVLALLPLFYLVGKKESIKKPAIKILSIIVTILAIIWIFQRI